MTHLPLEVYRIDMKYIRNYKYCVPLSKPKKKHEKMRDKIDFKKIVHNGTLVGVLNFNLMIPVEDAQIQRIDTKIRKHDNVDTRKKKELLLKELEWCNEHANDLTNTANVLYQKFISGEKFAARKQCLDFKKMELECKKYNERLRNSETKKGGMKWYMV